MFVDLNYFKFYLYVAIIYSVTFYLYFFFTKFNRTITVKEDFIIGSNKQILNLIHDTNDNLYLVDNKLMLLNFNAAEILAKIEKGKKYNITGYGFRVAFLDLYENITSCSLIKE